MWWREGKGGLRRHLGGHNFGVLEKAPGRWRLVRSGGGTWARVWIVPKKIVGGWGRLPEVNKYYRRPPGVLQKVIF